MHFMNTAFLYGHLRFDLMLLLMVKIWVVLGLFFALLASCSFLLFLTGAYPVPQPTYA